MNTRSLLAATGLVAAGAVAGVIASTSLTSTAGVSLTAPVTDDRSHGTVESAGLYLEWPESGDTTLTGRVYGVDGAGDRLPGTKTDVRIRVPAGEGAPEFALVGYAAQQGVTESCGATRSAILTVTEDMRTKLENFADSCLNE